MPLRFSVLLCATLASTLLAPAAALAQETPTFSVSITEPDEVIEQVGTTRRIDRAEIEARHARTLDEALRLVPGIYVRTGGDGTPRIDIRGFRSRHVLLLIDGVPFNSTDDGQFDPARISTESIEEIKVSYASSSVLYGDNAMGAVIEVVTAPRAANVEGLDLTLGTPDQRDAAGRVARTYGRLQFLLAGDAYSTDGFRLPGRFAPTTVENGGRRENSDRTRRELRANAAYAFSPTVKFATEWTVGDGAYGIPPGTIDNPADIFAQAVHYDRINAYRHASGQASLAFDPSARLTLRAWAYRNAQREDAARYDSSTYASIDNPLVPGTFQSRDDTTVSGSSVLGRIDLRRAGWLRVAINQRRERFDATGVLRDVAIGGSAGGGAGGGRGARQTPVTVTYGLRSFATDQHFDVYSAGSEWQFHPARRLGAVLGAAMNWQDRIDAATRAEPTWIAGVAYDATSRVRLHASATRKIRFPSISQLYDESAGNAALEPERAYGVDAGADRQFGGHSSVGLSVFSTRASNFIERNQGAQFVNRDTYRFSGVEASLDTQAIRNVDLRVAYTFLDSVDVGGGSGAELQYRPRHRASLEAGWRFAPNWVARGAIQGIADQRYYSRGAVPVEARAGDYTLVDANVTRTLARRCDVVVGVNNLFDQLYEQAYGLPREGRTGFITLRARFD